MKKNKKIDYLKLIVIFFILIILFLIVYKVYKLIKEPTDIVIVKNGEIYEEETQIGYIIREETVIQGKNYKNGMIEIKSEGDRVAKEEPVFRYYTANEDEITKKISDLDLKIQEALKKETNRFSSDIKQLENQIKEKVSNISNNNDLQKVLEDKKDIISYMTKKAKIAGELSPAGSYVKNLINQRVELENKLNSGSEYISSPVSGLVSYRIDNYESVLTTTDFSNLSIKLLQGLNLKTGQIISSSDNIGKVINNFHCYIAVIMNSENSKKSIVGDKVVLRLSNQKEITAEITYITEENDENRIIVFKIMQEVEYLVDFRKISVTVIWWQDTGLKVPNTAIIKENNLDYIIRNRSGYLEKILIKVVRKNESYSLVENYTIEELKTLGYAVPEISNMKKITIYDEILLKPTK